MDFEVVGDITGVETIASGSGIRERGRLRKRYGFGRGASEKVSPRSGWRRRNRSRRAAARVTFSHSLGR
jgi:hypothetical protein